MNDDPECTGPGIASNHDHRDRITLAYGSGDRSQGAYMRPLNLRYGRKYIAAASSKSPDPDFGLASIAKRTKPAEYTMEGNEMGTHAAGRITTPAFPYGSFGLSIEGRIASTAMAYSDRIASSNAPETARTLFGAPRWS